VGQLLGQLPAALESRNSTGRESARFQLRVAINVGPVFSDRAGVWGEPIITAARLAEAPDFKQALAGSAASLGVIASPFVYETVIRHGQDRCYSEIPVEVKESCTTAWMKLFGATRPLLTDGELPGGGLLDPLAALSEQEKRVLELIGEGLTNRQIAIRMLLAEKTVKNYVSSILTKLGTQRRTQAATFAVRR